MNEARALPHTLFEIASVIGPVRCEVQQWEIIVLDGGSTDNTGLVAQDMGACLGLDLKWSPAHDPPEGLAVSLLRGLREARGRFCLFMDSDGSHPPGLLPRLLEELGEGAAIAVASRHVEGAGMREMGTIRQCISLVWAGLSRPFFGISDPLSGCAAIDNARVRLPAAAPAGFKLLPEILRHNPRLPVREVGYIMRSRVAGDSKLDTGICVAMVRQWLNWLRSGPATQDEWEIERQIHEIPQGNMPLHRHGEG